MKDNSQQQEKKYLRISQATDRLFKADRKRDTGLKKTTNYTLYFS